MKQMGLKAKIRAKKAYRHPAMGEISEHLLKRRFKAQKPNEKWLTDVTELKGSDGKLYLSPILDLFNREIVAYAMSLRADSEMVKEMFEKAAPRLTDKGTMLHSDQGVLYRTAGYRELIAKHSMIRRPGESISAHLVVAAGLIMFLPTSRLVRPPSMSR